LRCCQKCSPGAILIGAQREFCRTWPDQTKITVSGRYFIRQDSGKKIGSAVAGRLYVATVRR
jgi:haloalkane dehalogenase